jgi:drug/metabolite transporter (DMT)-like permease
MMTRFYPAIFVLLWSTGFIGAKFGIPHADPLTFLLIRYVCVLALMLPLAWMARAPWPSDARAVFHLAVTGVLIHGVYLGGVFVSLADGLPAGIASLLVGMQPLLTAFLAAFLLKERVRPLQWLGLALGLAGSAIVLSGRLHATGAVSGVAAALLALFGITVGTLYQKRFCPHFDWRSGASVQFLAALIATLPVALLTERLRVDWTGEFLFALAWIVLVLSVGAIGLLNHLIRTGPAVHVASLFYLVPPSTALIAWFVFGETFTLLQTLGLIAAITGVALVRRQAQGN